MDSMADLDPFGRSKDEDPLAALGWAGEETAAGSEDPPPEPAPVDARAPRTRPPAGPSVQRVRVVAIVGALIAVVAGVVLAAIGGSTVQVDRVVTFAPPELPAIEPVQPGQPAQPAQPGQPAQREPAQQAAAQRGDAPLGLGRGSLLLPTAFGRAITRLRSDGYKGLMNLRVAPERIDAALITRGGSLRQVQITPDGAMRTFGTGSRGFGGLPTLPLKDVDGHAPLRLTTSAAGRLSVPPSRVNYLVYSRFAGAAQWSVYFKDGQIFSADARGRVIRRIS